MYPAVTHSGDLSTDRPVDVLVAFGANLGNREQAFATVLERLKPLAVGQIINPSSLYETEPVGGIEGQPRYLNAVIRFRSELGASELHRALLQIESELGRVRGERWGPRTVDLDLLLFGDLTLDSETLTIPHPRMLDRRFVLEPAVEVAGDMIHPVAKRDLKQLFDPLNENAPRSTGG